MSTTELTNQITKLNQDINGIRMILKGTPYMPQKTIISYFEQIEKKEKDWESLQEEHIKLTGQLFKEKPQEENKELNNSNDKLLIELKNMQIILQKLTSSLTEKQS